MRDVQTEATDGIAASSERVDTVTFTATDGTVVSFPPDFLIERRAIIADKINGENTIGIEFSLDGGTSWTRHDTAGTDAVR